MGISQASLPRSLAIVAAGALRASVAAGLFAFGAAAAAGTSIDVPTIVVQAGAARTGFVLDGTIQPVRQATVAAQVGDQPGAAGGLAGGGDGDDADGGAVDFEDNFGVGHEAGAGADVDGNGDLALGGDAHGGL